MIFEAEGQLFDSRNTPKPEAEVIFTAEQTYAARLLCRSDRDLSKIEKIQIVKKLSGMGLMHSKILIEWAQGNHDAVPF
jgi:ribosomal protein L7/L12